MGLKEYKSKRNFKNTPEPAGNVEDRKGEHRFVIQKHDASHLHYDLRLEMEGVYKSWAVPKGPSLDPRNKRLAMMVEDHPLEYGKFEGVIPEGNYGAGTVMLWDEGTYHAIGVEGHAENEKALLGMLEKGNVKIVFEGKKLHGEFAMVKLNRGKGNEWLLIKHRDEFASEDDITALDRSVVTNRNLEEIAAQSEEKNDVWYGSKPDVDLSKIKLAKKAPMPHKIRPMLATLGDKAFDSPQWIFEIKWDGFRTISECNYNTVNLYSRNTLSFNEHFPAVRERLKKLGLKAVLDGEIVVVDERGNARFDLIQNYKTSQGGNIKYYVFDVLYLDGYDLTQLPLLERKEILRKILPQDDIIRYNDHLTAAGIRFFDEASRQGLEGIVGKKGNSIYYTNSRSREWIKLKTEKRQEAIICGFTEPRGGRKHLGSLVLGVYDKGELLYIGQSGGGFNEESLSKTYQALRKLIIKKSPFKDVPKASTPITWVRPELVCEVKFQEWTNDGKLRVPIFIGMREDKSPDEVRRETESETGGINDYEKAKNKISESSIESESTESDAGSESGKTGKRRTIKAGSGKPKAVGMRQAVRRTDAKEENSKKPKAGSTAVKQVTRTSGKEKVFPLSALSTQKEGYFKVDKQVLKITNPGKIYWPEEGFTKGDVIRYYNQIAKYILPYLKDRPESLRRTPNGVGGEDFFQKNMPATTPEWIKQENIWSDSNQEYLNYMFCQDKASLIYMANLGCIEINPWNSRLQSLDKPDYTVIDLDPQDVPFSDVIDTALAVKEVLDKGKIKGYCKTSGSRGLHIYIPLGAKYSYEEAKNFAQLIAAMVHEMTPDVTSLERSPSKRKNKIYLDFLQNRAGQTLVAPYCLRPKPGAKVSTPLLWEEVKQGLDPMEFNIRTIFERLDKIGDIFKPVLGKGIDMQKCLKRLT